VITLPPLPFAKKALEPYISEQTLSFHYDKHHQTYVDKLNALIEASPQANQSLEEIILQSSGPVFNNAAQVWNHSFYWECLSDTHNQTPDKELMRAIDKCFGSYEQFITTFSQEAANIFGSGWCWLVLDPQKLSLRIITTQNAENPMTQALIPLLTCDVWEHAYYLDTQNQRPQYIKNYWAVVNWASVSSRYLQHIGKST
jgi:superoxide dismutase, Fe-Mn family